MSRAYSNFLHQLLVVSFFASYTASLLSISSLSKNDPYPMFSSLDPHAFLYDRERLSVKDPEVAKEKHTHVGLSLSPFGQNANSGRGFRGCQFLPQMVNVETVCVNDDSYERMFERF